MVGGHDSPSTTLARSSGEEAAVASAGDVLSEVLRAVRLTGAQFFLVDASAPWLAEVPEASLVAPAILPGAQHLISYHVLTRGRCWAGGAGHGGLWLEAGDVLLVPHGDLYTLATSPVPVGEQPLEAVLQFFRDLGAGRLPWTVQEGGGGPERVGVICGFLACDIVPFNPVLSMLPRLLRVRAPAHGQDRLGHLVEFALEESRQQRAGSDCVRLRISELMFVEVVRRYLASLPPEQTGWLAGLRDPTVGQAIALLHRRMAEPWTLAALAREVGASRSTLAERFVHFVGQPPMQYLARWRMQVAARLLADSIAKVSAVALEVGYESEAAFSRAFKKTVGVSPSTWRDKPAPARNTRALKTARGRP
jgi:AraC-like DNA-binding protein